MRHTIHYDQPGARLSLEGLPDVSSGQTGNAIGILTGWRLLLAGRPELEGRREHLEAMLQVVLPYARHLLSDLPRSFGGGELPASLGPGEGGTHILRLRSSQEGVEPLELRLDDAELADLVRLFDAMRLDARVPLPWQLPPDLPLRQRELQRRVSKRQRFAAPVAGVAALAAAGLVAALVPEPRPPVPQPAARTTTRPPAPPSPPPPVPGSLPRP